MLAWGKKNPFLTPLLFSPILKCVWWWQFKSDTAQKEGISQQFLIGTLLHDFFRHRQQKPHFYQSFLINIYCEVRNCKFKSLKQCKIKYHFVIGVFNVVWHYGHPNEYSSNDIFRGYFSAAILAEVVANLGSRKYVQ